MQACPPDPSATSGRTQKARPNTFVLVAAVLTVTVIATYIHNILSRFSFYGGLYKRYPFYVPESLDKVCIVFLCCLTLYLLHRRDWRGLAHELSLDAPVLPAVAFALACSAPMLIGFALTRGVNPHLRIPNVLFLNLFAPSVEELHVRGFGFGQLRRRARWPFWLAVVPQAVLAGLGHIEQGVGWRDVAEIFLLIASGAVVFSWLLERWQSLWVPFALHALMNLWWTVFSVSNNVLGGWFPFVVQNASILLAIGITLYCQRQKRGVVPEPPSLTKTPGLLKREVEGHEQSTDSANPLNRGAASGVKDKRS